MYILYDIYGKGIKKGEIILGTNTIDLASISAGLYILNFYDPDSASSFNTKIIKN